MRFELPEDLKAEFGVDLTPDVKQKIVGGNIARLYGINPEEKLKAIQNDEFAQRRSEYLGEQAVTPVQPPGLEQPATRTGVAGTESR